MSPARRHAMPATRKVTTSAALVRRAHRVPARKSRSVGSIVLGILLSLVLAAVMLVAAGVGVAGLVAATSISALSQGLPDPAELEQLSFAEPTVVYDRTGT